jgi:hypothetical protein
MSNLKADDITFDEYIEKVHNDTREATSFKVDQPSSPKETKKTKSRAFGSKRNIALDKWLDAHTDEEIRDLLLAQGNHKDVSKKLRVPRTVVVDVRRGLHTRVRKVVKKYKLPDCSIVGGKPQPTHNLFVNAKYVWLLFKIHSNGFQEVVAVFRTETSAEKYRDQYMFNNRHQFVYDKEKIYLKHPIVAYPVKRQRLK